MGEELKLASSDDRIDVICDAFEEAWREGARPKFDDYLARGTEVDRDSLFTELVLLDVDYRARAGELPDKVEYLARYPAFAEALETLAFRKQFDGRTWHDGPRRAPDFGSGQFVGRYELHERVGAGAAGEVWRAVDPRLNRTVALKLARAQSQSEAELERFLREAKATAGLRHPHIVPVFDAGRSGDVVFIASEFVDGLDLQRTLARERVSTKNAAETCAALAEALEYAHEQGVIHRDLKPANILIALDGTPFVADFGLAKRVQDAANLTLHGQLLGTPAYMSPEQVRGEASQVDGRTDMFSLGVILYEMLTCKRPFDGAQDVVFDAILHANPVPPRGLDRSIPRDLETICLKALEKDKRDRYARAGDMADDLRRFLKGLPIRARRTGVLRRMGKWTRRRPSVAAALALAAASLGLSAAAYELNQRNQELLGFRSVVVDTVPPQARVAFVPLDPANGEPRINDRVIASRWASHATQLQPGDYLVVAVLRDGRFHEVYRHVPSKAETLPGSHAHRRSLILEDGTIQLPAIELPPDDKFEAMAYIAGSDRFEIGNGSSALPRHRHPVKSFWMDVREFSVGDFEVMRGRLPDNHDASSRSDALSLNYDWVVAHGESLGKRLPSEAEFEFAATSGGRYRFSWCDEPRSEQFASFAAVDFDRLATNPPIVGLCSNKAEWTSSWPVPYQAKALANASIDISHWRVVRGGDFSTFEGDPRVSPDSRDPRQRHFVLRDRAYPGVGFRFVRSAAPLIGFDEM